MLWMNFNELPLEIKSYSSNHIYVVIRNPSDRSVSWRATGFYGYPSYSQRTPSWALLRRLNSFLIFLD